MAILFEVDRKFQDRFCKMLRKMGYDFDGTPYKDNPMTCFTVRPYWWGNEDAEEAELPNFEAPQIGLKLWWYKYPLRSSYCTMQFTEDVMSRLECIIEEVKLNGNRKMTFEEAVLEIQRYHCGEQDDFPFDALKAFKVATTSKICTMCKRRRECPLRDEDILECNFYIMEEEK